MSTNFHTALVDGPSSVVNAALFEGPLGQLDAAIASETAKVRSETLSRLAGSGNVQSLGLFNVMDAAYGAKGDGTTDDTNAIQAAINACVASGVVNARVVLPPASYKVRAGGLTISQPHMCVEGLGGYARLVTTGAGGNILTVTAEGVTLRNLYIDGAHNNVGHGIYAEDAYWLHIANCRVYGAQKHAFYTEDTWWVTVEDSLFSAADADSGYDACHHGANSNVITYRRCRFLSRAADWGVDIVTGTAIIIENCDFGGDATGNNGLLLEDVHGATIQGNYFESVEAVMIQLGATTTSDPPRAVSIRGNYLLFGSDASTIGIEVLGVQGCDISANRLYDIQSNTPVGIRIAPNNHLITGLRLGTDNDLSSCTVTNDGKRGADDSSRMVGWASSIPYNGMYYHAGDVIRNSAPALGGPLGWVCRTTGNSAKLWVTSTAYAAKSYCYASNSKLYYTAAGGTSGATEPTHTNGSASDGAVTWVYAGPLIGEIAWSAFGQVGYRDNDGSPSGALTPQFVGEEVLDWRNHIWYKAHGTTNTAWAALN